MKRYTPSPTLTIQAIALEKKKQGVPVHNFAAGDPVLPMHPATMQKAIQEIEKGFAPYPPTQGLFELRRLFSSWVNQICHTEFSPNEVIVTSGGKFAIFAAIHSLLETGDEVLIPAPYWVSYPPIVEMTGGKAKIIPSTPEKQWKITGKDIATHATDKSKALLINTANNPSGSVYTKEELEEILAVAEKLDLLIISDEVYSGLVYDPPGFVSLGSFPKQRNRIVLIQSCSKNFAMTGWRVGFALGKERFIEQLCSYQGHSITGVPLVCQWAALGTLEKAETIHEFVKTTMRSRRDFFIETFNSLFPHPIEKPASALYAFVPLTSFGLASTASSLKFCEKMIEKENIALVPGEAFGVSGYVRFAFTEENEKIGEGLNALAKALRRAE